MRKNQKWTPKMAEYQAKARQAEEQIQKRLFWKHIIITVAICFTVCFLAFQANDYFSEKITIEAETDDNGNINIFDVLMGDKYGESKNYSNEAK